MAREAQLYSDRQLSSIFCHFHRTCRQNQPFQRDSSGFFLQKHVAFFNFGNFYVPSCLLFLYWLLFHSPLFPLCLSGAASRNHFCPLSVPVPFPCCSPPSCSCTCFCSTPLLFGSLSVLLCLNGAASAKPLVPLSASVPLPSCSTLPKWRSVAKPFLFLISSCSIPPCSTAAWRNPSCCGAASRNLLFLYWLLFHSPLFPLLLSGAAS